MIACAIICQTFLAAQTSNDKITPVCSVVPGAIQVGQTSSALVLCAGGNVSSTQQIQTGDAFTVQFNIADGQIAALIPSVIVSSSTLDPADFVVALGSAPNSPVWSPTLGAAKTFCSERQRRGGIIRHRAEQSWGAEQSLFNSLRLPRITVPFQPSYLSPPLTSRWRRPDRRDQLDRQGTLRPPFTAARPAGSNWRHRPSRADWEDGTGQACRAPRLERVGRSARAPGTGWPGWPDWAHRPHQGSGAPGIASTIGVNEGSFTATGANINDSGTNQLHVSPGATVTVSFDWTINRNGFFARAV